MEVNIFFVIFSPIKENLADFCFIGSGGCVNVLFASKQSIESISNEEKKLFSAIHETAVGECELNYYYALPLVACYVNTYGSKKTRIITNDERSQVTCAKLREFFGLTKVTG